ncbi:hypothetical protein [Streptomyces lanatus]|uniref:UDP-N-acetylglucosamine kinase n=1 Tax=Streptomyces lanatus TaxID=66900 RepID=A0ABV1Y6I0_9ACTN|nr:hypothetical protein [Streptomyces lanatus]GHH30856.1 hypothetical protein GCM10018780_90880 [Streptomyces lanatus]
MSIVLIGGPPGAGKSTVAERLASAAEKPTVDIPTDSFCVWVRSGFVPPCLPEAATQNAVVQNVMTDAACAYARGAMTSSSTASWDPYAVLRPSLDVVLSRATAREGRQLKDVEPITGLYGAFGGIGALERCSAGLAEERFLIGG